MVTGLPSGAGAAPQTVALSGRGSSAAVPVLVWSPAVTRLDFGQVTAGSVSATQSLTLLNQGPGGASLTLLNAVGLDGAAYSVTSTACAAGQTLFEGASCAINVRTSSATNHM